MGREAGAAQVWLARHRQQKLVHREMRAGPAGLGPQGSLKEQNHGDNTKNGFRACKRYAVVSFPAPKQHNSTSSSAADPKIEPAARRGAFNSHGHGAATFKFKLQFAWETEGQTRDGCFLFSMQIWPLYCDTDKQTLSVPGIAANPSRALILLLQNHSAAAR